MVASHDDRRSGTAGLSADMGTQRGLALGVAREATESCMMLAYAQGNGRQHEGFALSVRAMRYLPH